MSSAASITDFDSDDDNYPYYNSDISVTSNRNINSSCSDDQQTSQSCCVNEFGNFEENYGWIQCQSKSYPNRVYYYNTRSCCKTWYRPISRYVDVPFVSIKKATGDPAESANDLELMSVSDDEKESNMSACNDKKSLIDASDIMARYYYTPQTDFIPSSPGTDDSGSIGANDCYVNKEQADANDENNNNADDSPLYVTNFLETEFFVKDTELTNLFNAPLQDKAFQTRRNIYGLPRLKRIGPKCQLIKPKRTRVTKTREEPGPRKIICDMYGVRTISYDLPAPDQACAAMGVKTSTLSASDSDSDDARVPPSPSRPAKTTTWSSAWRDIDENLHQPLLSDSSSSPSSRSDTTANSSPSRDTSSACSCCSCSSCSGKA